MNLETPSGRISMSQNFRIGLIIICGLRIVFLFCLMRDIQPRSVAASVKGIGLPNFKVESGSDTKVAI
jgi:hypothetical protein